MTSPFTPASAVEQLILDGDIAGTARHLRTHTPVERKALRARVLLLEELMEAARSDRKHRSGQRWPADPTEAQRRAVAVAIALCGTTKDLATCIVSADDLIKLACDGVPPSFEGLGDVILQADPRRIDIVLPLVAAGVLPRPESDDYALGLLAMGEWGRHRMERFQAAFEQDPGLADHALRVLDVEGTSELNLSGLEKYGSDAWGRKLLELCRSGVFSRDDLLARVLASLARDWTQFRAGWFSRFHATLAPTPTEMAPYTARYLALLGSRISPTVSFALDAVRTLERAGAVDGAALADALRPVMPSGNKKQIEAALALYQRVVAHATDLLPVASLAAAEGLVHEAPEVQARLLEHIALWGVDDAVRDMLVRQQRGLAPTNAAAMSRLLGRVSVPAHGAVQRNEVSAATHAASWLDADRKLVAPHSMAELVECIARVLEDSTDVETFDLAIAALVERAPLSSEDVVALGPVIKRALPVRSPLGSELGRLLNFLVTGTAAGASLARDHGGNESALHGLLAARTNEAIEAARVSKGLPLLSTPTHERGIIDPAVLVDRTAAWQQHGVTPFAGEQALSLLRLAPGMSDQALRERARALDDSPFVRALRHALGDEVPLDGDPFVFAAAARIRHPRQDDPALEDTAFPDGAVAASFAWRVEHRSHTVQETTYHHTVLHVDVTPPRPAGPVPLASQRHSPPGEARRYHAWWSFPGIDEGMVKYAATLLPSDPEAFFAEGARALGNNLSWDEAQWQNRAYITPLLDSAVPWGPMAVLLLGVSLAGKEPGQTALAVDAMVGAHENGRLDVDLLADTMRRLLAEGLVMAARYRRALDAALRLEASLSPVVITLLLAMLRAIPAQPPKDSAQLLELLREQLTASGRMLDAQAREVVAALVIGGKGKTLQKAMLAQAH